MEFDIRDADGLQTYAMCWHVSVSQPGQGTDDLTATFLTKSKSIIPIVPEAHRIMVKAFLWFSAPD
jgi:hypothetical protein